MNSSYNQTTPGIIQRPSSNVSAAPQPVPVQGQPNQQEQLLMLLLALLGGQNAGMPGMPAQGTPAPTTTPPPTNTPALPIRP